MKKNTTTNFFIKIVFTLLTISFVACFDHPGIDGGGFDCEPVSVTDAEIITHDTSDLNFDTNLVGLLHNNINVNDFQTAKAFYQRLGFTPPFPFDLDVNVSDPEEAQGLNLEPYTLIAAPMFSPDGFLIDLIEYTSPFDPEAPNNDVNDLGLSTLSLKTDNLLSDITVFKANNIEYTLLNGTEETPAKISFKDPTGTIIILTEVATDIPEFQGLNTSGETSIYGLFTTNINVSDLAEAIDFYMEVGFKITNIDKRIATISMPDGRHITLTESCNMDAPYENANHLGIARMAIITTDIDADIARLTAAGVTPYTPTAITPAGDLAIFRYVAFEDPDGTIIQLVEYFPTNVQ